MGCYKSGVESYNQACERTEPGERYRLLMGRTYCRHRIGDYVGTIDDLTEMVALRPDNAQCYTRRGITHAETADYEGAINDLEKAASLS